MTNPPLSQLAEEIDLKSIKSEFESLMGDHPLYTSPTWTIYGPYYRGDNRLHVIVYNGIKRITISYPKFIMECHLKRLLLDSEDVHHKLGLENNRLSSFEIKNKSVHIREHQQKYKDTEFKCPICNKLFILTAKQVRQRTMERKRGKNINGPYCDKICRDVAASKRG